MSTEIPVHKCPPAIGGGLDAKDINPITREEVKKARAEFRKEFGFLNPSKKRKPGRPKGNGPTKPKKGKPVVDLKAKEDARIKKQAEKLMAHANKYYPTTKRQRRWDFVVETMTLEGIERTIQENEFKTMKEIVRHYDWLCDRLEEQEQNAKE